MFFPFRTALLFPLFCIVIFASVSVYANDVLRVTDMQYKRQGNSEFFVLFTNEATSQHKLFVLSNPTRLVLDIPRVKNTDITLPEVPSRSVVGSLRFGHFSPVTSRFVFALKDGLKSKKLHQFRAKEGTSHRLVLELKRNETFENVTRLTKKELKALVPVPEKKPFFAGDQAHKPMIIIDAGHGGKDPGAVSDGQLLEKHITLKYAHALRTALLKTGDYNVTMTRHEDDYIYLHDRVRMAREASGDLFISIHADSAGEAYAKGLSVYTVSQEASDREAAKLAQAENAADNIGGIDFADDHPDVADILIDLASRDTRIKSNELAGLLVDSVKAQNINLLTNPSRHAGFRVLKAPDIPSVLVEVGFLSNAEDEKLLQQSGHRNKVSRALVRAVDAYFQKHPKK